MQKAVRHLKKADPVLAAIIHKIGPCGLQFRPPTFESLVRSIVFQQLSGRVATVIYDRLAAAACEITPPRLLALEPAAMRKFGLSGQKSAYILDLARLTADGTVDFTVLPAIGDEEVIASLTRVKGVGVWTAQMFLMFALARPDVLPTGDLGIRKAMQLAYGLKELPKPDVMEKIAKPWRPHASVACWYLWRSLDGPAAG